MLQKHVFTIIIHSQNTMWYHKDKDNIVKNCFLTLKNDEVSQTTPIKDSIGPILAQCRFADFGPQENQYWPNTGYNTAGSEEAG